MQLSSSSTAPFQGAIRDGVMSQTTRLALTCSMELDQIEWGSRYTSRAPCCRTSLDMRTHRSARPRCGACGARLRHIGSGKRDGIG